MSGWFRRMITEALDGYRNRNREIVWEKAHGKGTFGRNRFGDHFWLYDMSAGYGADKRWSLTASPLCPDGRRFCSVHDQNVYHGADYNEAKRAAQKWANQCWPMSSETP